MNLGARSCRIVPKNYKIAMNSSEKGSAAAVAYKDSVKKNVSALRERLLSGQTALYAASVAATAAVGLVVVSPTLGITQSSALSVLHLYAFVALASWIAISFSLGSDDIVEYLKFFATSVLLFAPIAGMYFDLPSGYRELCFWLALLIWLAIGIGDVLDKAQGWQRFLLALGAAWSISGVIITLGNSPLLSYAREAISRVVAISVFLDPRLTLTALLTVAIVGTAFVRALARTPPNVPSIARPQLPLPTSLKGLYGPLMAPFIHLINVFLLVLFSALEVLWKAVVHVFFFFVRLGEELPKTVRTLFAEREAVLWVARVLGAFFVFLVAALIIKVCAGPAYSYLRAETWTNSSVPLLQLTGLTALLTLCVAALRWLSEETTERIESGPTLGLATLLSIQVLSGGILIGLARIDKLSIVGFSHPGPLMAFVLLLVAGGLATLFPWLKQEGEGSKMASHAGDQEGAE